MSGSIWRELGIERTADTSAIRRAYATALRAMDPDADPDGFARLRAARDKALAMARSAAEEPDDESSAVAEGAPVPAAISPLDASTWLAPVAGDARGTIDLAIGPAEPKPLTEAGTDTGIGTPLALPEAGFEAPVLHAGHGDVVVLAPASTTLYDDAYSEVLRLLFAEQDEPWLDEADTARLHERIAFLLADSRMDRLAFSEDAERWFADVLADSIPRSDPVLRQVSRHFGWTAAAGTITLPDAAERVAERARAFAFAEEQQVPSNPDHKLWAELSRPAHEKSRRNCFIGKRRMRKYLDTIRTRYPDAEAFFDPMRVALWDKPVVQGPSWAWWIIGVVFIVRLIISLNTNHDRVEPKAVPTPPPVVALWPGDEAEVPPRSDIVITGNPKPGPVLVSDRSRDLDLGLLAFADGLTMGRVRPANPALAAALEARWRDAAREGRSLDAFIQQTFRFLAEQADAALARADYGDLESLRRLDLVDLNAARAKGSATCARFLDGTLPLREFRSRAEDQRRRRLLAAILLDSGGSGSPRKRSFSIPGPIMTRLSEETGLDRAALSAALQDGGTPAARCTARRALLTTALDLPPEEGLPILRGM